MKLAQSIRDSDRKLQRLSPLLQFHPTVSERFEALNGEARVQNLRWSIAVGLIFYNAYNFTDLVLRPDIVPLAISLRLLVTAVLVGLMISFGRVSAPVREFLLTLGMIAAASVPTFLFWVSASELGLFTFSELFIVIAYGTLMLALRFPHAIVFTMAAFAAGNLALALHPSHQDAVLTALLLQMLTACSVCLVGNYRIERIARMSYLQALSATFRSQQLEASRKAYAQLSSTDALTGIGNRRMLDETLAKWTKDAMETRRPLSVLMLDVDHFKPFNDGYGHIAGDDCLVQIGKALQDEVRGDIDLAARFGGEEFCLVLRGLSRAETEAAASRICKAVEALGVAHAHRHDGVGVVTVSIGVAIALNGHAISPLALLTAADAALYRAKKAGRNRLVIGNTLAAAAA